MKHIATCGNAIATFLTLAAMLGCQGVSTGSPPPTGGLSWGSPSLSFGNVTAGTSKMLTVSATNTGTTAITISGATVSTKNFSLSAPSLPVTIGAGQNATASIVFTPNAAGSFVATLSVTNDASTQPPALSLTGTGVADGQLVPNPTNESFGNITVGSQHSQSVTLTNNGASNVTISSASVSGPGFQFSGLTTPLTLNASKSTTFTITFAPQATGTAIGSVTITSDASNPTLSIPLSGTGVAVAGALGSNPTSLGFGSVHVGSTQTLPETVTNTGGSSVTISQVAASGAGFGVSGISTPVTLAAGQSATFSGTFTPQSPGSVSGNITISSNASNPTLTIPLSGTGNATAGQLAATPTALNLGNVVVGTSGIASGSLNASGASVIVAAAGTNNAQFTVSGLSLPVTIPAGQSVPFTITFSPQTAVTVNATLTVTSNASPSSTTESLTGTGTPAPVHSVNLSWTASTSPNISGYNIYRAVYVNSCGSYSKINSLLNTGTIYTDSSVIDGVTYCYATSAVDSTGAESSYSNIAQAVIPPP